MSKQFEELSKNLASGMSRRKAFGRFAAGIGAAFAAVALPGLARAKESEAAVTFCDSYCRDILHLEGDEQRDCILDCERLILVNGPA